ncbi:MAG: tetratricopeptide repeat protein, partial [bacterium]
MLGISHVYKEEKRLRLAFKYAKQSMNWYAKVNEPVLYGSSISNLGSIYGLFGKFTEALEHYEKAKKILEKLNYKLELLKLHNLMGETYLKMGDTLRAIENLELAKSMALEIRQNIELRKIYDHLYQAYDKKGDTVKAYQALKDYTELNKKIYGSTIQA